MIEVMMQSEFLKIPLTLSARICAEKFSRQQSHPQKIKQVYQNTLAVFAVNNYLQCLGWITRLETSDSWNPLMQTLLDIADLELVDYGKLECRCLQPEERVIVIPEEVILDRIAYIAVELEEAENCAYLLGFIPKIATSIVAVDDLQPIADLPEYLEQYISNLSNQNQELQLPKLSNWLSGVIEAGWDTLDRLFEDQSQVVFRIAPAQLNFRTGMMSHPSTEQEATEFLTPGVSRVKLWELGKPEDYCKIAVVISVLPTDNKVLEISIKVCPTSEQNYLPAGLVIKILDETQQPVLQAQTKVNNENIEFFLSGEPDESFSIQIIFNEEIQTESFII